LSARRGELKADAQLGRTSPFADTGRSDRRNLIVTNGGYRPIATVQSNSLLASLICIAIPNDAYGSEFIAIFKLGLTRRDFDHCLANLLRSNCRADRPKKPEQQVLPYVGLFFRRSNVVRSVSNYFQFASVREIKKRLST
jgi:hypothetical protein